MLRQVIKAVTNALFPNKCQACRRFFHPTGDDLRRNVSGRIQPNEPIEKVFHRLMSPFLCPECITRFSPIHSPYCTRCGRMFHAMTDDDNHLCGNCIKTAEYYHTVRSAGIYDGSIMALIHAFKYNGMIQLARPLGMLLYAAYLRYYDDCRFDLVLPVPLHTSKLKQRGFNQSTLILREWGRLIRPDTPLLGTDLKKEVIIRKKKTVSQTGLGREKRKTNIKNAFKVTEAQQVAGKRILLIDDVFTTGATTNECARVLTDCRAESVDVLTIARAD